MSRKKVLVIEFDPRDSALLAGSLQRHGYVPLTAATAQEGVEKYFNEYPDLVVCNLLMPDMQGAELINRLRARDYRAPIIAINQLAAGGALFVKRLGADDQIAKPIDEGRFTQLVANFLGPGAPAKGESNGEEKAAGKAAAPDEGIPASGRLKSLPFHQLLARAYRQRLTGLLSIKQDAERVDVAFRDGLPLVVAAEGLIRQLARSGLIDDAQAKAARRQAASGITEQAAVAEIKAVPAEQLRQISREFAYETLYALCRPSDARFRWKAEPVDAPADAAPLDPALVLKVAVEQHQSPEKIHAAFAAKGRIDKPLHLGDDPARLPDARGNPALRAVLHAARRGQTLASLLNGASVPSERLDRAAYALAMLRAITFEPEEAWTPPAEPAPPPAEPEQPAPPKAPEVKPAPPPPADAEPSDEPLTEPQLLQIGIEMLRSKTYSKAQACFADLLERRGDDRQALMLFAKAAFRNRFADPLDRLLDAVEALRRALRLDPRFAEARFALAQILAESNELALAAAELETLLSFEPGHVEAQRELRNIRRRTSAAG